jgi:hypothetical protein
MLSMNIADNDPLIAASIMDTFLKLIEKTESKFSLGG